MLNVYFYWQSCLNPKLCLQNKSPKNKNNLPTPCFHTLSAAAYCIWQWSDPPPLHGSMRPSLGSQRCRPRWTPSHFCYEYSATFIFLGEVCFLQNFTSSKSSFFWGGLIKQRKLVTTLLAITRLLDFELTTLPYPTRNWKTTTCWGLVVIWKT